MKNFFQRVYEVVRLVPFGRVTTYGLIAEYLASRTSARMVGWALNNSHFIEPYVPAHRVVNRNGILTGKHHFGGNDIMQKLLENEGIKIKDNKVVNFKKLCWNPLLELKLE